MTTNKPAVAMSGVMMNREVAPGIFLISLRLPAEFPTPAPGQFVMLRIGESHDPLLRRPFSIHAFQRRDDSAVLEILYRVVGRGTKLLSLLEREQAVNILGPLGNGFTIIPARKNIVIVAGGMGIAPLWFLIEQYRELIRSDASLGGLFRRIICYVGAATADHLVELQKIEACCEEVKISTDDGSCGYHGNVIELLRRDLAFYNPDDAAVYACGPSVMLKALAEIIPDDTLFCQVSMEERMACGLGACLGCAVPGKAGDGHLAYRRVCKDGPVFNIGDVLNVASTTREQPV